MGDTSAGDECHIKSAKRSQGRDRTGRGNEVARLRDYPQLKIQHNLLRQMAEMSRQGAINFTTVEMATPTDNDLMKWLR